MGGCIPEVLIFFDQQHSLIVEPFLETLEFGQQLLNSDGQIRILGLEVPDLDILRVDDSVDILET